MAEVRPIPSAVGAFEAQVIDFNKTYKAIVDNAAAIRKRQAQAQKDIEKQMDVALADKRAIRPQDSDYVEEKRQEVYNYYFQNRDNIMAGGKSAGELKMKMGEFTSAVNQSSSLNRRGMSLNPAWKEAMKDENQMDDGLTEVQRVWSLPINDPNRKDAKFDRGGFQASIDEFDVPDISYYKKFNETKDLDDAITRNVKPYTPDVMTLTKNTKLGIYADQLTETRIYDPYGIVGQVESVANSKSRSFLANYTPQLAVYKSLPEWERQSEFNGVMDAYKDLSGVDMRPWFQKGDGQFIDNELELAAFKKLQAKMPQVIKDTYDYRTQSILLKQWQLNLSRSRFAFQKEKESEEEGFDATLTKAIKSGKFNKDEWNAYMNGWSNIDHPGASGVRAGGYEFSSPDSNGKVTVTYYTQVPLKDAEGKNLTSANGITKAQADQNVRGNSKLRSASTNVKAELSRDGIWYAQMERTTILDPKAANLAPSISNMNSYVQDAIPIDAAKTEFKEGRKGKKWKESKQFIPDNE